MNTYTLHICGLTRELPLVHISKKTKLANFSILGDVELVDALADKMTEMIRPLSFDYLVCPEVKIVPLIHGVAKRLGHKRYVVCRKSVKPYMASPIILKPLPHFPKHVQQIVINGADAVRIHLLNIRVTIPAYHDQLFLIGYPDITCSRCLG